MTRQADRRLTWLKFMTQLGYSGELFGREKEEDHLNIAAQRCFLQKRQELILIEGSPGTGKTALAQSLKTSHVLKKQKAHFVSGTFESQAVTAPYEVIIAAMTDFTELFLDTADETQLVKMKEAIVEVAGPTETKLLCELIPALKSILNVPGSQQLSRSDSTATTITNKTRDGGSNNNNNRYYGMEAQHRMRLLFCNYIRALASQSPLVLVLDDLQWADTASCELIRALMMHQHMPVLIIGTHWCDLTTNKKIEDVEKVKSICVKCLLMSPFVATVRSLEEEPTVRLQNIVISDLTVKAINSLLMSLFLRSEDMTLPLAQVVFDQTKGNAFCIQRFIRLLLEQNYVVKDSGGSWQWDAATISTQLHPESILTIVTNNLCSLPAPAQEALKVASCMGDEIDDSALDLVLGTATGRLLEQAANEGLLVFYPQFGGYRFAHNWIRRAAYEMIEDKEEFHLRVGRKLWKSSCPAALEKNVFVVVSLLNKGTKLMKEQRERYKVAEFNLKAAERAVYLSSFKDASKYLRKAISLLGQNRWNDDYDLALCIFSTGAEVEAINGQYDRVVSYIEEIVSNARSLVCKLRAYRALIRSMFEQGNLEEATSVAIDVLQQLGESFPATPTKSSLLKEFNKTKNALRGKSNEDILNLPAAQDPLKIAALQIIHDIFMHSYTTRSPFTSLIAFRSVQITIKYGLNEASATTFALYGMTLCGLGMDVQAGRRYGDVAISLAELLQSRQYLPMVYFLVGFGISHWSGPIQDGLENLLYSSRSAMDVGDVEIACIAKITKCYHQLFSGGKILSAQEEVEQVLLMARSYHKQSTETLSLIVLQFSQCLVGGTRNPARLNGDYLEFNNCIRQCAETHNRSWAALLLFEAAVLAYLFHEYEYAREMIESSREQLGSSPSSTIPAMELLFVETLNCIALARANVHRAANLKLAKQNHKSLLKWSKDTPTIMEHRRLLVEAEFASLLNGFKKVSATEQLYEDCIQLATKHNCRHVSAIAWERYGDFTELLCGDPVGARTHYTHAITIYNEWGALAKAKHIQHRHKMS